MSTTPEQEVPAAHIVWTDAGLSRDGETVALTAAIQPSIEKMALGALDHLAPHPHPGLEHSLRPAVVPFRGARVDAEVSRVAGYPDEPGVGGQSPAGGEPGRVGADSGDDLRLGMCPESAGGQLVGVDPSVQLECLGGQAGDQSGCGVFARQPHGLGLGGGGRGSRHGRDSPRPRAVLARVASNTVVFGDSDRGGGLEAGEHDRRAAGRAAEGSLWRREDAGSSSHNRWLIPRTQPAMRSSPRAASRVSLTTCSLLALTASRQSGWPPELARRPPAAGGHQDRGHQRGGVATQLDRLPAARSRSCPPAQPVARSRCGHAHPPREHHYLAVGLHRPGARSRPCRYHSRPRAAAEPPPDHSCCRWSTPWRTEWKIPPTGP